MIKIRRKAKVKNGAFSISIFLPSLNWIAGDAIRNTTSFILSSTGNMGHMHDLVNMAILGTE